MAAPNKKLVNGVEKLEFALIPLAGGMPASGDWKRLENVAPGTVSYTTNADTTSNVIPEDKDTSIFTITTPGDPDSFNFGLLELDDVTYGLLFNTVFAPATNTITVLASRKRAALAIRLTTRPVNGVKKIYTYPLTEAVTTYVNNFTKDALVQFGVTASIMSYGQVNGQDAIYTIQTVNADGTTIDATPVG